MHMQPVNDDELVLLHYGELDAREAEALRARFANDSELLANRASHIGDRPRDEIGLLSRNPSEDGSEDLR